MNDAVVLAAVLGVLGGIVLTVLLLLVRRFARGTADLGSAAERASYQAMHRVSLAARHLRGGLNGPDVSRAARHFRVLLGSAAVAIIGEGDAVAIDGAADGLEDASIRIANAVRDSGRRQVFPSPEGEELEAGLGSSVGMVFVIAASTLSPIVLLGVWWAGLTARGAVAGMVSGGLACALSLLVYAAVDGVGAAAPLLAQPAAWTIPLATAVAVGVSLLDTRGIPTRVDRYLARLHSPERA